MPRIAYKVVRRLQVSLKRFKPILKLALERDCNESDTVLIVTDLLAELFGYDKYNEITSEYVIKNTYCDLAIKIDGNLHYLVEVKAIGCDLSESHIKQAVDYAANAGVDWVILTNGQRWVIFRIFFTKPIAHEQVAEFNLLELTSRRAGDTQSLFLLCREAIKQSTLKRHYEQSQASNRFLLGAAILTEPVIKSICREMKRANQNISIDPDQVKSVLCEEVLKREVIHGDRATSAKKKFKRSQGRALRKKNAKQGEVA